MKKIKILSLALASLLILQATNSSCFFGKPKSVFPINEFTMVMIKTTAFISIATILSTIIISTTLKLTNNDGLYVGIWRRPRTNEQQKNPIILLTNPSYNGKDIYHITGISCFNKKNKTKWPNDKLGHKLNIEKNIKQNTDWKKQQKEKYEKTKSQKIVNKNLNNIK